MQKIVRSPGKGKAVTQGLLYQAKEIQPIRTQESRYTFNGITPLLPIMRRAYVTFILLSSVFSLTWYKIVTKTLSWYRLEYPTCYLQISW